MPPATIAGPADGGQAERGQGQRVAGALDAKDWTGSLPPAVRQAQPALSEIALLAVAKAPLQADHLSRGIALGEEPDRPVGRDRLVTDRQKAEVRGRQAEQSPEFCPCLLTELGHVQPKP